MYPRIFLAVLTVLLGVIPPTLALPVQLSHAFSLDARAADLAPEATALAARETDEEEYMLARVWEEEASAFARAYDDAVLLPRAKSAAEIAANKAASLARKNKVRNQVAASQVANAAKKIHIQAETDKLSKGFKYGKPRVNKKTGLPPPGHRASARKAGLRPPKQPKTPKPNFAKGEHKTNAKAVKSQEEAKLRMQQRKADGRAKWGHAKATHQETLKHGNMPHRKDSYPVPNHETLTGKDVRQGAFLLALHDGKNGKYPVTFRNQEQGPPDGRHVPLPHMVGTGKEYPIKKGGYHPGDKDQGPVRGIYQKNVNGGYNVTGVLSHDVSKKKGDAGYNDHIVVPHVEFHKP